MRNFTQQTAFNFGVRCVLCGSFFLLLANNAAASDCELKLKEPTKIELALLKSSDPLVRFVAHPSQAAAQILAQPASQLMDEPILARMAFSTLCEPSAEQTGLFRSTINGLAFSHLAQISASSTPDVIDELIRRTQYDSDWDDGFAAIAQRLERGIAEVPAELLAANALVGDVSFQKLNETQREVALENARWSGAYAYAAYGLPKFEFLIRACKGEKLEATAKRRTLCTSLGQGLESKSSSLISVLIGIAILKNLGGNEVDIAALNARHDAWKTLYQSLTPAILPDDAPIKTRMDALAAENTNTRHQVKMGEVNAALTIYAESENADLKVVELLRDVRQ